mmetsp:Transcript_10943/g.37975  ORF Transcript_10943/g.37975 Transcript_10943/m.37975 type:complete len:334 (+) Transcript_10943:203-1204(+)
MLAFAVMWVALACLLAGGLYAQWEQVEAFLAKFLARQMSNKLGVPVTIGKLFLRRTQLKAVDCTLGNGPGTWEAPYFAHVDEVEVCTPDLWGTLSLPGPVRRGDFFFGFSRRSVSTVALRGLRAYVEEDSSKRKNMDFLSKLEEADKAKKMARCRAALAKDRAWRKKWCTAVEEADAARDDDDAALDVDDDDALDVRSLGARLGAFTAVLESSKGQSLADRAEAVHAHYRKVQLLKKNDTELRQKYKADRAARRLEVWRVGRATVSDCRVDVLGHGMRLDGFFVLNAFEGTLKELQAKVAQGVVSDMLRGAATHKLEQTRALRDSIAVLQAKC